MPKFYIIAKKFSKEFGGYKKFDERIVMAKSKYQAINIYRKSKGNPKGVVYRAFEKKES